MQDPAPLLRKAILQAQSNAKGGARAEQLQVKKFLFTSCRSTHMFLDHALCKDIVVPTHHLIAILEHLCLHPF